MGFEGITFLEIWMPFVFLAFISAIIEGGTLYCPKCWSTFRTRIRVTNTILPSFPYTEFPSCSWGRMITFTFHNGYAGSASTRTLTPGTPLTPTAVDRHRWLHHWYAFLILAPLEKVNLKHNSSILFKKDSFPMLTLFL